MNVLKRRALILVLLVLCLFGLTILGASAAVDTTTTATTTQNADSVASATVTVGDAAPALYYYTDLATAIAEADENTTVTLLKDVTISSELAVEKALTIDGNDSTIFSTATRNMFSVFASMNFVDVTITNTYANGRCIDTRTDGIEVNLTNVTLNTTGVTSGNDQPLTIGGSDMNGLTITLTNSTINTSKSGYAAIIFVPVELTITDSELTGFGVIYAKEGSAGSLVTIEGSTLTSNNVHSGESNDFAAIVFEDSGVELSLSNSQIVTTATGDQPQSAFGMQNNAVADITIDAATTFDIADANDSGFLAFDKANPPTLNVAADNAAVKELLNNEGFVAEDYDNDGVLDVAPPVEEGEAYVARVGTVLYTNLADAIAAAQNGDTVIVLANATVTETIAITNNLTIKSVDGSTFTVTKDTAVTGYLFTVSGGAQFTLSNINVATNGAFVTASGANGAITLESGATISGASSATPFFNVTAAFGTIEMKSGSKLEVTSAPAAISLMNASAAISDIKLNGTIKIGTVDAPVELPAATILFQLPNLTQITFGGDIDVYVSKNSCVLIRTGGASACTKVYFTGTIDHHVSGYTGTSAMSSMVKDDASSYGIEAIFDGATLNQSHEGSASGGNAAAYSAAFYMYRASTSITVKNSTINIGAAGQGHPFVYTHGNTGGNLKLNLVGGTVINILGTTGYAQIIRDKGAVVTATADATGTPVIKSTTNITMFAGVSTLTFNDIVIDVKNIGGTISSATNVYYASDAVATACGYAYRVNEQTLGGDGEYATAKKGYYKTLSEAQAAATGSGDVIYSAATGNAAMGSFDDDAAAIAAGFKFRVGALANKHYAADLVAAIDLAANNDTVYVLADVSVATTATITGKTITLTALNDAVITNTSATYFVSLANNSVLNLQNIKYKGNCFATFSNASGNTATLELQAGAIVEGGDPTQASGHIFNAGTATGAITITIKANASVIRPASYTLPVEIVTSNVIFDMRIASGSASLTLNVYGNLQNLTTIPAGAKTQNTSNSTWHEGGNANLLYSNLAGGTTINIYDGAVVEATSNCAMHSRNYQGILYLAGFGSNTATVNIMGGTVTSHGANPMIYFNAAYSNLHISGNAQISMPDATQGIARYATANNADASNNIFTVDASNGATVSLNCAAYVAANRPTAKFSSDAVARSLGWGARIADTEGVGTVYYADVYTALGAVADGGTIWIIGDVKQTGEYSLTKSVTIKGINAQSVYTVTTTATVPFMVKTNATLKFENVKYTVGARLARMDGNNSSLILASGAVMNHNGGGSGIFIYNNGLGDATPTYTIDFQAGSTVNATGALGNGLIYHNSANAAGTTATVYFNGTVNVTGNHPLVKDVDKNGQYTIYIDVSKVTCGATAWFSNVLRENVPAAPESTKIYAKGFASTAEGAAWGYNSGASAMTYSADSSKEWNYMFLYHSSMTTYQYDGFLNSYGGEMWQLRSTGNLWWTQTYKNFGELKLKSYNGATITSPNSTRIRVIGTTLILDGIHITLNGGADIGIHAGSADTPSVLKLVNGATITASASTQAVKFMSDGNDLFATKSHAHLIVTEGTSITGNAAAFFAPAGWNGSVTIEGSVSTTGTGAALSLAQDTNLKVTIPEALFDKCTNLVIFDGTSYYTSLTAVIATIPEGGEGTVTVIAPITTAATVAFSNKNVTIVTDGDHAISYTGTGDFFQITNLGTLTFNGLNLSTSGVLVRYFTTASSIAKADRDIVINLVNTHITANGAANELISSYGHFDKNDATTKSDSVTFNVDADSQIDFTTSSTGDVKFIRYDHNSHDTVYANIHGIVNVTVTGDSETAGFYFVRSNNPSTTQITVSETAKITITLPAGRQASGASYFTSSTGGNNSTNKLNLHLDAISDNGALTLGGVKLFANWTAACAFDITIFAGDTSMESILTAWQTKNNLGTTDATDDVLVNLITFRTQVGNTYVYGTLNAMFAAAENEGTVTAIANCTVTQAALLSGKTVTLTALENVVVTNTSTTYFVRMGSNTVLNVEDFKYQGNCFLTFTNSNGTAVLNLNDGAIIEGGDPTQASGYLIADAGDAKGAVTININEGAELVRPASYTLSGLVATSNTIIQLGGGSTANVTINVYGKLANLTTIADDAYTMIKNDATQYPGADAGILYHNLADSTFTVNIYDGAVIEGTCNAATYGGNYHGLFYFAVSGNNTSNLNIYGGTITSHGVNPLAYMCAKTSNMKIEGAPKISMPDLAYGMVWFGSNVGTSLTLGLEEGYEMNINGKGYYATAQGANAPVVLAVSGITDAEAIAQGMFFRYNDVYYETLAAAIALIPDGGEGTVYVLGNVTCGGVATIENKKVTVTSVGTTKYTLTLTGYPNFNMDNNSHLIINNVKILCARGFAAFVNADTTSTAKLELNAGAEVEIQHYTNGYFVYGAAGMNTGILTVNLKQGSSVKLLSDGTISGAQQGLFQFWSTVSGSTADAHKVAAGSTITVDGTIIYGLTFDPNGTSGTNRAAMFKMSDNTLSLFINEHADIQLLHTNAIAGSWSNIVCMDASTAATQVIFNGGKYTLAENCGMIGLNGSNFPGTYEIKNGAIIQGDSDFLVSDYAATDGVNSTKILFQDVNIGSFRVAQNNKLPNTVLVNVGFTDVAAARANYATARIGADVTKGYYSSLATAAAALQTGDILYDVTVGEVALVATFDSDADAIAAGFPIRIGALEDKLYVSSLQVAIGGLSEGKTIYILANISTAGLTLTGVNVTIEGVGNVTIDATSATGALFTLASSADANTTLTLKNLTITLGANNLVLANSATVNNGAHTVVAEGLTVTANADKAIFHLNSAAANLDVIDNGSTYTAQYLFYISNAGALDFDLTGTTIRATIYRSADGASGTGGTLGSATDPVTLTDVILEPNNGVASGGFTFRRSTTAYIEVYGGHFNLRSVAYNAPFADTEASGAGFIGGRDGFTPVINVKIAKSATSGAEFHIVGWATNYSQYTNIVSVSGNGSPIVNFEASDASFKSYSNRCYFFAVWGTASANFEFTDCSFDNANGPGTFYFASTAHATLNNCTLVSGKCGSFAQLSFGDDATAIAFGAKVRVGDTASGKVGVVYFDTLTAALTAAPADNGNGGQTMVYLLGDTTQGLLGEGTIADHKFSKKVHITSLGETPFTVTTTSYAFYFGPGADVTFTNVTYDLVSRFCRIDGSCNITFGAGCTMISKDSIFIYSNNNNTANDHTTATPSYLDMNCTIDIQEGAEIRSTGAIATALIYRDGTQKNMNLTLKIAGKITMTAAKPVYSANAVTFTNLVIDPKNVDITSGSEQWFVRSTNADSVFLSFNDFASVQEAVEWAYTHTNATSVTYNADPEAEWKYTFVYHTQFTHAQHNVLNSHGGEIWQIRTAGSIYQTMQFINEGTVTIKSYQGATIALQNVVRFRVQNTTLILDGITIKLDGGSSIGIHGGSEAAPSMLKLVNGAKLTGPSYNACQLVYFMADNGGKYSHLYVDETSVIESTAPSAALANNSHVIWAHGGWANGSITIKGTVTSAANAGNVYLLTLNGNGENELNFDGATLSITGTATGNATLIQVLGGCIAVYENINNSTFDLSTATAASKQELVVRGGMKFKGLTGDEAAVKATELGLNVRFGDVFSQVLSTAIINLIPEGTAYEFVLTGTTYIYDPVQIFNRDITFVGSNNADYDLIFAGAANSTAFIVVTNGSLTFKNMNIQTNAQLVAYSGANNLTFANGAIEINLVNTDVTATLTNGYIVSSSLIASTAHAPKNASNTYVQANTVTVNIDKDSVINFTSSFAGSVYFISFNHNSHKWVYANIDGTVNMSATSDTNNDTMLVRSNNPALTQVVISDTAKVAVTLSATRKTNGQAYITSATGGYTADNKLTMHLSAITKDGALTVEGMKLFSIWSVSSAFDVRILATDTAMTDVLLAWLGRCSNSTSATTDDTDQYPIAAYMQVDGIYYYTSLGGLISLIPEGGSGTITVGTQIIITSEVAIHDRDITLVGSPDFLGDYHLKFTGAASAWAFSIYGKGTLTFKDLRIHTTGILVDINANKKVAGAKADKNHIINFVNTDVVAEGAMSSFIASRQHYHISGGSGEQSNKVVVTIDADSSVVMTTSTTGHIWFFSFNHNTHVEMNAYVYGSITINSTHTAFAADRELTVVRVNNPARHEMVFGDNAKLVMNFADDTAKHYIGIYWTGTNKLIMNINAITENGALTLDNALLFCASPASCIPTIGITGAADTSMQTTLLNWQGNAGGITTDKHAFVTPIAFRTQDSEGKYAYGCIGGAAYAAADGGTIVLLRADIALTPTTITNKTVTLTGEESGYIIRNNTTSYLINLGSGAHLTIVDLTIIGNRLVRFTAAAGTTSSLTLGDGAYLEGGALEKDAFMLFGDSLWGEAVITIGANAAIIRPSTYVLNDAAAESPTIFRFNANGYYTMNVYGQLKNQTTIVNGVRHNAGIGYCNSRHGMILNIYDGADIEATVDSTAHNGYYQGAFYFAVWGANKYEFNIYGGTIVSRGINALAYFGNNYVTVRIQGTPTILMPNLTYDMLCIHNTLYMDNSEVNMWVDVEEGATIDLHGRSFFYHAGPENSKVTPNKFFTDDNAAQYGFGYRVVDEEGNTWYAASLNSAVALSRNGGVIYLVGDVNEYNAYSVLDKYLFLQSVDGHQYTINFKVNSSAKGHVFKVTTGTKESPVRMYINNVNFSGTAQGSLFYLAENANGIFELTGCNMNGGTGLISLTGGSTATITVHKGNYTMAYSPFSAVDYATLNVYAYDLTIVTTGSGDENSLLFLRDSATGYITIKGGSANTNWHTFYTRAGTTAHVNIENFSIVTSMWGMASQSGTTWYVNLTNVNIHSKTTTATRLYATKGSYINIMGGSISTGKKDGTNPAVMTFGGDIAVNIFDAYIASPYMSAISGLAKTVSITIYGGTFIYNGTESTYAPIMLPKEGNLTVKGGTFINTSGMGPVFSNTVYANNLLKLEAYNAISNSSNLTLNFSTVEGSAPTANLGAYGRLTLNTLMMTRGARPAFVGNAGAMTFKSTVSKSAYEYMQSLAVGGEVKFGMLVIPTELLKDGVNFTHSGLANYSSVFGDKYELGVDYFDYKATASNLTFEDDGCVTIRLTHSDIDAENYNTKYSVVFYAEYEVMAQIGTEKDGTPIYGKVSTTANGTDVYSATVYRYADYEESENARSLAEVAYAAYNNPAESFSDAQKALLKTWCGDQVAEKTLDIFLVAGGSNAVGNTPFTQQYAETLIDHVCTTCGHTADNALFAASNYTCVNTLVHGKPLTIKDGKCYCSCGYVYDIEKGIPDEIDPDTGDVLTYIVAPGTPVEALPEGLTCPATLTCGAAKATFQNVLKTTASNVFYSGIISQRAPQVFASTTAYATASQYIPVGSTPTLGLGWASDMIGPEYGMATELAKHYSGTKYAAIMKYAFNDAALVAEDAYYSNFSGELYKNFMQMVADQIAVYADLGYKVNIAGLYWMQGEADLDNASAYAAALQQLVTNARADLSQITGTDLSGMPVVVGEVATFTGTADNANRTALKNAQNTVTGVIIDQTSAYMADANGIFVDAQNVADTGARVAAKILNAKDGNITVPTIQNTTAYLDDEGNEIAGTGHTSLAMSLIAAPSGTTIALKADQTVYTSMSVTNRDDIVIAGDGNTIKVVTDAPALALQNASVTLEKVAIEHNGSSAAITLDQSSTLVVEEDTEITAERTAIEMIGNASKLVINGGIFTTTSEQAETTDAIIRTTNANVTITDGSFNAASGSSIVRIEKNAVHKLIVNITGGNFLTTDKQVQKVDSQGHFIPGEYDTIESVAFVNNCPTAIMVIDPTVLALHPDLDVHNVAMAG